MHYLAPDYLYTPQGLQSHLLLAIADDGRISSLIPSEQVEDQQHIERLPGMALLPGFVNAHSHVFQRALRGHTHRPLARQDSFWTWRNAMYAEAGRLDPATLYEVALRTYREMLAAGYTSVGEFHYVHHQPDGTAYAHPNAMAEALGRAGHDAGIRVVLLMTAYAQSGFDQQPLEEQRRFCDASVDAYLERVEMLRASGVPVGVAPHSVRAVSAAWLLAIVAYSHAHDLPLHIHASEQVAEVEQCRAWYGCGPIELLARYGVLSARTTLVHATHADAEEIALLARYGCTVCVCPTTEGDLGDGIAPYAELLAAGVPLCIGADSNTRLDPLEELRWAEYSARMRYQRRRVLVENALSAPGPLLLDYGTRRGATALALQTGVIAPGMWADLIAVDLAHPVLRGWSEIDLLDTLFFGASASVIASTWVQGRRVWP